MRQFSWSDFVTDEEADHVRDHAAWRAAMTLMPDLEMYEALCAEVMWQLYPQRAMDYAFSCFLLPWPGT